MQNTPGENNPHSTPMLQFKECNIINNDFP